MSEVFVLDVGHGNCTIVRAGKSIAVVDAPAGSIMIDALEQMGVKHVEHALISHADADHIQGILALLTSDRISVGNLWVNPDRDRQSTAWRDLVKAVMVASRCGTFKTHTSLTVSTPGKIVLGDVSMIVVSPSEALALSAVGGHSPSGRPTTANSLSAAIRVENHGGQGVLLAGDIDFVGLTDAISSGADLRASALVYPHHGGLPGSAKAGEFVKTLLAAVAPRSVYVSNGRNKHANPRTEVVDALLDHGCTVSCTQLAKSCGEPSGADHLETWPSAGRAQQHSCAGTITLTLTESGAVRSVESATAFRAHLESSVATPMCARLRH